MYSTTATTDTADRWEKRDAQQEIQKTGLSVEAPSSTNNDTSKIVIVVQQIMTEISGAASEKDKIMVITKLVLNLTKQKSARVHRPIKIIEFNGNGIWRRRYELSKQLHDLNINVALLSETHLKPHERFFTPNYYFYRTRRFPGRKGGTAVAVTL
jgi:hypothetical protein